MKKNVGIVIMVLYSIFIAYHLFINLIGGVPTDEAAAKVYTIQALILAVLLSASMFYTLYCTFFVWKPSSKKDKEKTSISLEEMFCTLEKERLVTNEEKKLLKKILNRVKKFEEQGEK